MFLHLRINRDRLKLLYMKRILNFLLLAVLLGAMGSCQKSEYDAGTSKEPGLKSALIVQPTYIVTFSDDFLKDELNASAAYEGRQKAMQVAAEQALQSAGIFVAQVEFVYTTAMKGFSVKMHPGQVRKLEQNNAVISIEQDQIVMLKEPFGRVVRQASIATASLQPIPWGIERVKGGINYKGDNVAWVLDSGIELKHPDLNVDSIRSRTFIANTTPNDENGHGTHVAGIIAAINNDSGVVGVAAGAPLISVRVLDSAAKGTVAGVIAGVDYVAAHAKAGDVANMSIIGGASDALDQAVLNASEKCYFILAAGNNSASATLYSPARVEGPNIYTVSAMGTNDTWASYSNFGNPPVDYCAPGTSIYSTFLNGGYATLSGTSMAAPHVAGILLLGYLKTDGVVIGDPDGTPDPIAIYGGTITIEPENPTPGNGDDSGVGENYTITLSASSVRVKGLRTATLSWTGGKPGATATIYRNGSIIAFRTNDSNGNGSYIDNLERLGGIMTYKVCDVSCSNEIKVK